VPKRIFILKQSEFELNLLVFNCLQRPVLKGFVEDYDKMYK